MKSFIWYIFLLATSLSLPVLAVLEERQAFSTAAVACGATGYYACAVEDSGGCCPIGLKCARTGCVPSASTSTEQPLRPHAQDTVDTLLARRLLVPDVVLVDTSVIKPLIVDKGLTAGQISGIVIGIVGFLALSGLAGYLFLRRRRRKLGAGSPTDGSMTHAKPELEAKEIRLSELQSKTDASELPVIITPQELGGVDEIHEVYELESEPRIRAEDPQTKGGRGL